jgi:hypothetical protein
MLAVLITILAIYGTVPSGLKGDLGWLATVIADDIVHPARLTLSTAPIGTTSGAMGSLTRTGACGFARCTAGGATLRLGKAALLVERLLPRGEDECAAAVGAVQRTILEI